VDELIKILKKVNGLRLLHVPSIYSLDIDFISERHPKEFLLQFVKENSSNYELINFVKEDISESVQLQFKDNSTNKFYWVDIFFDSLGTGYFSTKSETILRLQILDVKYKELKKIFKFKFQFKLMFNFRKIFVSKKVLLNLISNKLYKLINLLKLLFNKQGIFFLGEEIKVVDAEINQLYIKNINSIIHSSKYSYIKWKFYYRFKGFTYLNTNLKYTQNLDEELKKNSLFRLNKYLELYS
jgi:hypothetical protein